MSFFFFMWKFVYIFALLNLKIMDYFIIGMYLLGYIVSYRMFMKEEDHLVDGWGLVFLGLYFSLLSWVAVLIYFLFECKSEPPRWLTLKRKRIPRAFKKRSK